MPIPQNNIKKQQELDVCQSSFQSTPFQSNLQVNKNQVIKNHGDHAIVFFDVVSYKTISERGLLTTSYLIDKKIIL